MGGVVDSSQRRCLLAFVGLNLTQTEVCDMWHEHLGREVPDYAKAREAAKRVREENSITGAFADVYEIAQNDGLRVVIGHFPEKWGDVAGFINFDKKEMGINAADPEVRGRFTAAHELGHWFLHRSLFQSHPEQYKVMTRAPLGRIKDPLEQEANAFAAALLVPLDILKKYAHIAYDDELGRLFGVSEEVIRYRRKDLR
jgi:Zn-dependent peptidase ImmA (M78 family)